MSAICDPGPWSLVKQLLHQQHVSKKCFTYFVHFSFCISLMAAELEDFPNRNLSWKFRDGGGGGGGFSSPPWRGTLSETPSDLHSPLSVRLSVWVPRRLGVKSTTFVSSVPTTSFSSSSEDDAFFSSSSRLSSSLVCFSIFFCCL